FVPVSQLLDFLWEQRGSLSISPAEIAAMERRWLADRVAHAASHVFRLRPFKTRPIQRAGDSRSPNNSKIQSKKRIVHITSAHGSSDVRIFYRECQSLARAGYEVIELTNDAQNAQWGGVRIRGLGFNRGRIQRVTTNLLRMAREAFRMKGDVYHIHDPELLLLALLLRVRKKCVIYDVHENLPSTVLYKHYIPARIRLPIMGLVDFLETPAARRMSGLVTATSSIAERFRHLNRNCVVVRNFPDLSELPAVQPMQWAQRSMAVAYIGGIAEERGIRELLAAMGY